MHAWFGIRLKLTLLASVVCAFLCINSLAFAAEYSPKIEDYAAAPEVELMRISPSGKYVAFVKHIPDSNDGDMILVYSLEEQKIRTGAYLGELTPYDLTFVSDAQLVFRAGQPRKIRSFVGDIELGTAYRLNIDSGGIEQVLVPGKDAYLGQYDLGKITGLSPDMKYAFMPACTTEKQVDSGVLRYSLLKVDLSNQENVDVEERGTTATYKYFVDQMGELLAELRYDHKTRQHQVISYLNDAPAVIYEKVGSKPKFLSGGISPDGKSIVVAFYGKGGAPESITEISLQDGTHSKPVFPHRESGIKKFYLDTQGVVHGVLYAGLTPEYDFYDQEITRRLDEFSRKMEGTSVRLMDWSKGFHHMVVFVEGAMSSGDYYLLKKDGTAQFLSASRPNIESADINPIGQVTFVARDGLKVPTLITVPKHTAMKDLPAIVLPYANVGGQDTMSFDWMAQALASHGYLVIQPQVRGSSGISALHSLAGYGEWGNKMQNDLTDAVNFFAKKGMLDSQRVCIVGMDYGGYAALAGAAFTPELYKCAVSINGASELWQMLNDLELEVGEDSSHFARTMNMVFGDQARSKAVAKDRSPLYAAEKIKASVLLVHTEKDVFVRASQSKKMYKALKKAGSKVERVTLKGDDHFLVAEESRFNVLSAVLSFVNAQLEAKPAIKGNTGQKANL